MSCGIAVSALAVGLPRLLAMKPTLMTDVPGVLVTMVLFATGGFAVAHDIETELSLARERMRSEQLARAAEQAHLMALRAHLDPHFLFNTLNAIAEWCRQDPEVAEQATLRLAQMLRVILEGVSAERWPLSRELDLVRDLFELHRTRDPERLSYTVHDSVERAETVMKLHNVSGEALDYGLYLAP